MSKKTTAATADTPAGDETAALPADAGTENPTQTAESGTEQAPNDGQAQASLLDQEAAESATEQASDPAAEQAAAAIVQPVTGVLLRRECVDGIWYPHGTILRDLSPQLAISLKDDGALDLNPAAIEHAVAQGGAVIQHVPPVAEGDAAQ